MTSEDIPEVCEYCDHYRNEHNNGTGYCLTCATDSNRFECPYFDEP